MIKTLRFTFLWLFVDLIVFCCSKEKEPAPEPIPEDTKTTREYLASKARKQILTFDANSPLRIVTEKGLIIEAKPNVWKDDKSGATITGSIQLEVTDFSSNKDFIFNHVGSLNPYMNIYNKIIRFERGFRISPTQDGKNLSGKLTLKVPLKDPLIIAGNRAQLVFCAQSTDPDGQPNLTKWAPSSVTSFLNNYFPATVVDNFTNKQYYEVEDLGIFNRLLGIGDNWPPYATGTISCNALGKWISPSKAKPVIYVIPSNHLAPQRLDISGEVFTQQAGEGIFPTGTDVTIVGIQYEKGKVFFAKKIHKICSDPNLELRFEEVSEQVLMSELDAL